MPLALSDPDRAGGEGPGTGLSSPLWLPGGPLAGLPPDASLSGGGAGIGRDALNAPDELAHAEELEGALVGRIRLSDPLASGGDDSLWEAELPGGGHPRAHL